MVKKNNYKFNIGIAIAILIVTILLITSMFLTIYAIRNPLNSNEVIKFAFNDFRVNSVVIFSVTFWLIIIFAFFDFVLLILHIIFQFKKKNAFYCIPALLTKILLIITSVLVIWFVFASVSEINAQIGSTKNFTFGFILFLGSSIGLIMLKCILFGIIAKRSET